MTVWSEDKLDLLPREDSLRKFFVRVKGDPDAEKEKLDQIFGPVQIVRAPGLEDEFGFVTEKMSEGSYEEKAERLGNILHMIRVEE